MDPYGESLPSHSIFVRHIVDSDEVDNTSNDIKPSVLRASIDKNNNTTTTTITNAGDSWTPRSSNDWANKTLSPPPPPPPTVRSSVNSSNNKPFPSQSKLSSSSVLTSSQSFKSSTTKPINSNEKKEIVKRPFLKKGSRKEPSAIHRVQRAESSSPVTTNTYETSNNNTTTTTSTATRPQTARGKMSSSSSFKAGDDFEHEAVVKGSNYYRPSSNPSPINTMSYTNTYSKNHMATLTYDDNNTSILNEGISMQLRLKQTTALQELDEFAMLEKELETMNDSPIQPFYDNNNKKNNNQSITKYNNDDYKANNNDDDDDDDNDDEPYSNNDELFTRTGTYSSDKPLLGTTRVSTSSSSPFKYSGTSAFQDNSHSNYYGDRDVTDDYDIEEDDNKDDDMDDVNDDDLYGIYDTKPYQKYNEDDNLILPPKQNSRSIDTSSFAKTASHSIDSSIRKSNTGSSNNATWGAVSRPDIKAMVSSSFYREESENSPKVASQMRGSVQSRGSVKGNNVNNIKGAKGQEPQQDADSLQATLREKAKELESELATYKEENASLKQLRKQQETALAEIVHQRTDLMKWIHDEKQKTEAFCEEQKQAAIKERRSAAKLARDSRQKALVGGGVGNVPIRKEREEIDGLKATIEKLKVDIENNTKKAKMNERRLGQMLKDSQEESDNLNQRILGLEAEKATLWEYLDQESVRVPASISRGRPKKKVAPKPNYGEYDSYVEEVDIDYVTSAHVVSSYVQDHSTKYSQSEMDMMSSQESFIDNKGRYHSNNKDIPPLPDDRNRSENKKYSATYDSIQPSSSSSASSSKLNKTTFDLNTNVLESFNSKGSKGSRGSRSSRYSSGDDEADSDLYASTERVNTNSSIGQDSNSLALKQLSTNNYSTRDFSSTATVDNTINNKKDDDNNNNINNNRPEEVFPDGRKIIKYRNGTTKEVFPNGSSIVRFANGDRKHTDSTTGLVVYFYSEAQTKHTTFPDGTEVYEFPNKQIERHFANGLKEILFPDKTKKLIYPDGAQESIFPDGVRVREQPNGFKETIVP